MVEAAGVILAAGRSSRMEGFKPLLDFGGSPLLQKQIETFRRAGIKRVWVVTGHRSEELTSLAEAAGATAVYNKDHDAGMFSSVLAGARAVSDTGLPFFLLPVDFPLIPPFLLRLQLEAYEKAGGGVVYSSFDNCKGHPPLIAPGLLPVILASDGEGGLQAVLRQSAAITYVPAWDGRVCTDIDTSAEYESALAVYAKKSVRSMDVCNYLYTLLSTTAGVKAHCAAVARAVCLLALALNVKGFVLDVKRLYCAGMLHDIKKGTPRHDVTGAALLDAMDYGETAALIARHMNLPEGEKLGETALLYYADKITDGAEYKTPAQRRADAAACDEKAAHMAARLDAAVRIEGEIRAALGEDGFAAVIREIFYG